MYKTLFYVGLIVMLACLILAIVLFFVLKIPKAFGVVTGRAQKKAIEEIRTHGYESQSKKKNVVERIQVRNAEMDTGSLKVNKNSEKLTEKESDDSDKLRSRRGRAGKDLTLENEQTEVLGFESKAEGAFTTAGKTAKAAFGEQDSTDVLSADGSVPESGGMDRTSFRDTDDQGSEESTDVLTGSGSTAGGRSPSDLNEESTDVLTSDGRIRSADSGKESGRTDFDIEETDVLTSGLHRTPADDEIVGRYSAEETAVLRSMHARPDSSYDGAFGVRVLLSETVVHTDESLS